MYDLPTGYIFSAYVVVVVVEGQGGILP